MMDKDCRKIFVNSENANDREKLKCCMEGKLIIFDKGKNSNSNKMLATSNDEKIYPMEQPVYS